MTNLTLLNTVFNSNRQVSVINGNENFSTHNQISVIGLGYNYGIMGNIGYSSAGMIGPDRYGFVNSWIGRNLSLGRV